MDSGHGKNNNNNNVKRGVVTAVVDRLSSLPDDLIHKILSNISIKDAVQTIDVLSSRYRYIWTTLPYLNLSTEDFPRSQKVSKFVRQFLKRRDSRVDVSSLKLSFRGEVTQPFVKKLMDYAFSHNIQQLDVTCLLLENDHFEFPLSMFDSQSLKHLSWKTTQYSRYDLTPTSTLELPALTTLYLQHIIFCSDDNCDALLSKCPNLKNLTLKSCKTNGLSSLSICHPRLSNLTLDDIGRYNNVKLVNVVAPQLENLTIRCRDYSRQEHVIFAPNLASLAYSGFYPLHLNSTDGFRCLYEADIRVSHPNDYQMVCLLQQLYNLKFLKLNLEIIELLSSSVELIVISHRPSPFVNLKSLIIYPAKLGLPKRKVDLSSKVKSYLLDSSPGATFTMFSHEEMIVVRDFALARKLMEELQVLLEQEKADTNTKRKAMSESHKSMV